MATTNPVSALVDRRRMNSAYSMLAMYSKKSDQLGPFNGNISPLPRISAVLPGRAGIINIVRRRDIITDDSAILVPSHCTLPCIINVTTPNMAPIITSGWRRMRRRLKKSFIDILFQRSSYA